MTKKQKTKKGKTSRIKNDAKELVKEIKRRRRAHSPLSSETKPPPKLSRAELARTTKKLDAKRRKTRQPKTKTIRTTKRKAKKK